MRPLRYSINVTLESVGNISTLRRRAPPGWPPSPDVIHACGIGSWGGQRLRMAAITVTGTGPTSAAAAAGWGLVLA